MSSNQLIELNEVEAQPDYYYDFNIVTPNHPLFSEIDEKYRNLGEKDFKKVANEHKKLMHVKQAARRFYADIISANYDERKINFNVPEVLWLSENGTDKFVSRREFYEQALKEKLEEEEIKKELEIFEREYSDVLRLTGQKKCPIKETKLEQLIEKGFTEREFTYSGELEIPDYYARQACKTVEIEENPQNVEMMSDIITSCFQGFVQSQTKEKIIQEGIMNYDRYCLSEKMLTALKMIFEIKTNCLVTAKEGLLWKDFFIAKKMFKEYERLILIKDRALLHAHLNTKERISLFKKTLGKRAKYMKMDMKQFSHILRCNPTLGYKGFAADSLAFMAKRKNRLWKILKLPLFVWVLTLELISVNKGLNI